MGTAIDPNTIERFELTEVYNHPDAKVDIVLVHGLNGHPQKTWTSPKGVFWPTQLLPVSLKSSQARILVYGYNADVYSFGERGPSSDLIHNHAETLLNSLKSNRTLEEVEDHPIIWIAHSLGGILVKRALMMSRNIQEKKLDDLRSIMISTYGIIFLGTPHTGADPAKWGLMLQRMVKVLMPKAIMHTENQLVKTLQSNNETLQNINIEFADMANLFQICMVHETQQTELKGMGKTLIVDNVSASPPLPGVKYFGIEATHSLMCKFETKNSPGWANVASNIKTWVEASSTLIELRQQKEKEDRARIDENRVKEIMREHVPSVKPATSGNTPDPGSVNNSMIIVPHHISIEPEDSEVSDQIFIKPPSFRPNSLFVGREVQLAEMHKMLLDVKRRSDGTSAISLQSIPGGGKTHLARQYVYKHRDSYPGGIFWVAAKSEEELVAGYWDIARKAVFRDVAVKQGGLNLRNSQEWIGLVKEWLDSHHEWLLVLDGIHFNESAALRKYIPDSERTSLIYTSTEKGIGGNHHLMNPQMIRLPSLTAREAQRLFLMELGKNEPFTTDDLKYAMEIVQGINFLPIVIHTYAQRLRLTEEPLAKAAKSYASEPRLKGLDTFRDVLAHLERLSPEAVRLMKILCFYGQRVPVEMISLGIKALDVPVKTMDPLNGRNLNNTFRYLNMFALMDRNEQESRSLESSQNSKGSQDLLGENVDVIRLHGVIQGFFIDTIDADKSLPHFLYRAVIVFCDSYTKASERISSKTIAGLVEDYRVYEIHGKRLEHHIIKYQRKYPHILDEVHEALEISLSKIKEEIDQRTPGSSQNIVQGRPEEFQISIFDRTSSSSDTGPETPGCTPDHAIIRWYGNELDQTESPLRITHDALDNHRPQSNVAQEPRRMQLLLPYEDIGYESEMDGSAAMTAQPSQRTIKQDGSPNSPGGEWETVKSRRANKEDKLENHRTVNWLDQTRYHDRAGSYRAVIGSQTPDPRAINPALSHKIAKGFVQRTGSRGHSRGRISGQSSAEAALTHISQASPPAPRGGGMVRDRSSSQKPASNDRGRMRMGTSSYAAATTGQTKDTISGYRDSTQPIPIPNSSITGSVGSSAMDFLQDKYPIDIVRQPASPRSPITLMPPYPITPSVDERDRYFSPDIHNDQFDTPMLDAHQSYGSPGQDIVLAPYATPNMQRNVLPVTLYPMRSGPIPLETQNQNRSRAYSGPPKRSLPHDYASWHEQSYVNSDDRVPALMSLSSPNIRTYIPGRPELSFSSTEHGYTSQPMSRDTSGQSKQSLGRGRRRSVAETEPLPNRPHISPPTNYQAYQAKNGPEMPHLRNLQREQSPAQRARKSPRLGQVHQTLETWDGGIENLPPPRRAFNPTTPAFQPSSLFSRANSTQTSKLLARSPDLNNASPPLHHSAPVTTHPSPNSFITNMPYHSSPWAPPPLPRTSPPHPLSHQFRPPSPRRVNPGPWGAPRNFTAAEEPDPMTPRWEVEMRRGGGGSGGSGGIRVGGGLIQFGETESVDTVRARARVERTWVERGESGLSEGVGLGINSMR